MAVTGLLEDPEAFALVIPTYNGTAFLKRTLDYLREAGFPGLILLSDNSTGAHRDFIPACADSYPELWLETRQYPAAIRFLDKLVDSPEHLDSRSVMLCAHDDFVIVPELDRLVALLEEDSSLAAARGRVAMVELARAPGSATAAPPVASLSPHPMRAYLQDDPVERVLDHIRRYASTFYSVHRRANLIESFRLTEAATKNVVFFQYFSSCLAALQGKIACTDSLFYVRQGHAGSWSGSLKRSRDYEHWPMLITSPAWSQYYREFRDALLREIQRRAPSSMVDPGALDEAFVALVRRSLTGIEEDNAEEAGFLRRLKEAHTGEHAALARVVAFAARYPDTF